ncbi:hypothetical protein L6164_003754 [Bauhinia variegata]|uniref:Uncharacterized protein n=1 Tax=Bauhinia variegata TaxID=167791 RepID=A0ACB9Q4Z6_BAUVA|nr:hypothetical protein L6164_003754 [Bauhinia variegata]
MDNYLTLLLLLSFLWASIVFFFSLGKQSQTSPKLPPGPPPYPIIGNLLDLVGDKAYRALTNLSKTYGKLMTLKLGSTTAIIISSPEMAKEALHKHDLAFSSRTIPDAAKALDHHKVSILWSPATAHWRTLRKVSAINLFSPKQLDSTQVHRESKLGELLQHVEEKCARGEAIDVGEVVFTTILNSISNTFFSIDLAGYSSDLSHEFKDIVLSMGLLAGKPNIVDYFPALSVFDPQRIRKTMTNYFHKIFRIFNSIIDERMQKEDPYAGSDLLASLLNLTKENSGFTRRDLLHLLLDLFLAGVDTTSSAVEWAMAELLRNPETMIKARKELKQALGKDDQETASPRNQRKREWSDRNVKPLVDINTRK